MYNYYVCIIYVYTCHIHRFFGLIWYRPIIIEWVTQSEFSEMMIDEEMVSDHMPDALYKELVKLEKQERLHIV